jgi:hypothetical protein
LFLALLGTTAFGADVYRSQAADGTISYSDRPQGENSEYMLVRTPRAGSGGPTSAPQPQTANAAAATAPTAATPPGTAAVPTMPTAEETRAERAKNCTTARERAQRLAVSHRLYRNNPAGEREYLNDGEIDEARAKAVADVADWCG